jgi:hypothetical protein
MPHPGPVTTLLSERIRRGWIVETETLTTGKLSDCSTQKIDRGIPQHLLTKSPIRNIVDRMPGNNQMK